MKTFYKKLFKDRQFPKRIRATLKNLLAANNILMLISVKGNHALQHYAPINLVHYILLSASIFKQIKLKR